MATIAPAPHGLGIISPFTSYLISMALLRPETPSSPLAPHMCACLLPPSHPGTLPLHHPAPIGSPSRILVPAMLRSLVGAPLRSHVPALRRPSSFLMGAPSCFAAPALLRLAVPPGCCTRPGHLERMPQGTRSSRSSSLPPPPIVGTGAADQGQQRGHSPPGSSPHFADGRNRLLVVCASRRRTGFFLPKPSGAAAPIGPSEKAPFRPPF